MKRFIAGIAVAAFAAAGVASVAAAKTWNAGPFSCEDGKQASVRGGVAPVSTATVTGADNVGQCIMKCTAMANCKTVNIRHVPNAAAKTDNTVCTFYATSSVAKTNFASIQGKQWGAVCIRK